jgi:hypothetical protein
MHAHRTTAALAGRDGSRKRALADADPARYGDRPGFTGTCALDKGYDGRLIYEACEDRDIHPIIPLKVTVGVQAGWHLPPSCNHGTWTFAGSDAKRGASKWRCPAAKCAPGSTWVRADRLHTLIPRTTDRWRSLYRERVAVEHEFGVLMHEWAMLPLRVRRLNRVRLHVDLTILARLGYALSRAKTAAKAA